MDLDALSVALANACRAQDYNAVSDIIRQCPPNINTRAALTFLTAGNRHYTMVGLDSMATAYVFGNNYNYAELFGRAAVAEAFHLYDHRVGEADKDQFYYTGHTFYVVAKTLSETGRHDELVKLFGEVQAQYPELINTQSFVSARLEVVESLLHLDEIEAARNLIQSIAEHLVSTTDRVQYDRLLGSIEALTDEVVALPEEAESARKSRAEASYINIAEAFNTLASDDNSLSNAQITEWLGEIGQKSGEDQFAAATRFFESMYGHLQGLSSAGSADNLATLRMRRLQVEKILMDASRGHNLPELESALLEFKDLLPRFKAINSGGDYETTLYCLYICHSRLNRDEAAAEYLEELRDRLEHARSKLTNISERAGVFRSFPYLFSGLAEMHYRSSNVAGLFEAVEAAKGRNLADKMSEEVVDETSVGHAGKLLPELKATLQKADYHYLSYFIDETWTYAVLVSKNGRMIATEIDLGRKGLEDWVRKGYPDPLNWEKPRSGLFGTKVDVGRLLGPFLKPIEVAIEEGFILAGEHIAYAPDGLQYFFPLHYARFADNSYLIEHFSLSRIHGAGQFIHSMHKPPRKAFDALSVCTPAEQDIADAEKVKAFSSMQQWLSSHVSARAMVPEVGTVLQRMGPGQLIHFSTHGTFPKKTFDDPKQNNPFYSCGLLLRDGNKLPVLDPLFRYYQSGNLLSPSRLLDANVELDGSHVTLQACVSGYAQSGIGGDALGLEWSLFHAGAASLLCASWDIGLTDANVFCEKFYRAWLIDGKSRAAAYQDAMLQLLRDEHGGSRPVSSWGGFTLSGDFR